MRGIINIVLIIAVLAAIMITPVMAFEPGECDIEVHPGDLLNAKADSATDGQTVCVYAGTYGWFTLNTPNVTLKGEGADKVTLDCEGTRSAIGNVEPHHAPGCIVDGFKFISSDMGIEVHLGSPDCIVRNCVFDGLSLYVHLRPSNTTFENNIVTNTTGQYSAVYLREADNSTVANNTIINNKCTHATSSRALCLRASNCVATNNTITGNNGDGIRLYKTTAADNIIKGNNISSNTRCGFYLKDAGNGNKIYLNDIVDNPVSVIIDGGTPTNIWNSTEQIEYVYGSTEYTNYLGNNWSDYTGSDGDGDGDGDGIGDVPYIIPGSMDMDHRPLMAGFENYPAPAAGICGDVNEDTSVDFIDVGLVGRHKLYGDALADEWAADVNGDDSIDFIDVGLIGRHKLYGDALCCK